MTIDIDQIAPDFEQDTANGSIRFYEWLGRDWCVLFTHRGDLEPVSLTEIAEVTRMKPSWDERGVKVLGLSHHNADRLRRWEPDFRALHGHAVNFPLIADSDGSVAALYGLAGDKAPDQATAHWIFVPVQTPANWREGDKVVVAVDLPDGEARALFPEGWTAVLPNFRLIAQPARQPPGRALNEAMEATVASLRRDRDRIGAGIAHKALRDAVLIASVSVV